MPWIWSAPLQVNHDSSVTHQLRSQIQHTDASYVNEPCYCYNLYCIRALVFLRIFAANNVLLINYNENLCKDSKKLWNRDLEAVLIKKQERTIFCAKLIWLQRFGCNHIQGGRMNMPERLSKAAALFSTQLRSSIDHTNKLMPEPLVNTYSITLLFWMVERLRVSCNDLPLKFRKINTTGLLLVNSQRNGSTSERKQGCVPCFSDKTRFFPLKTTFQKCSIDSVIGSEIQLCQKHNSNPGFEKITPTQFFQNRITCFWMSVVFERRTCFSLRNQVLAQPGFPGVFQTYKTRSRSITVELRRRNLLKVEVEKHEGKINCIRVKKFPFQFCVHTRQVDAVIPKFQGLNHLTCYMSTHRSITVPTCILNV